MRQCLVPTLSPGDTVIIDNLSSHKVPGGREAIEAAAVILLYLLPYSPAFNPIEQVFAKLKALFRKAAARTLDALETAIAAALRASSPHECSNYITAAGYVLHLGKCSGGEVSEAVFVRDLRYTEVLVTEHELIPLNMLRIKSLGQGGIKGAWRGHCAAGGTRLPAIPQCMNELLRRSRE